MSSDPTLPASVEAVRELPEEIERAIVEVIVAQQAHVRAEVRGDLNTAARAVRAGQSARAALTTAILSRLTTAERACDSYARDNQQLSDKADAALARVERLEKALEFYADDKNYRLNGPLDPNSSWFDGNNRARAALSAEEVKP